MPWCVRLLDEYTVRASCVPAFERIEDEDSGIIDVRRRPEVTGKRH
jgi:hypothetical protein